MAGKLRLKGQTLYFYILREGDRRKKIAWKRRNLRKATASDPTRKWKWWRG